MSDSAKLGVPGAGGGGREYGLHDVWAGAAPSASDTALMRQQLGSASPLAMQLLGGLPLTAAQIPAALAVTSLPANPVDGQEVSFVANATQGTVWRFKYRAASTSAYKWEFIGGSPIIVQVNSQEGLATVSSWLNLATPGPLTTLPLAGDYFVDAACSGIAPATGAAGCFIGVHYNASAFPVVYAQSTPAAANYGDSLAIKTYLAGCAAGTDVRIKYYVSVANGSFFYRVMTVLPVRVG